MLKVLLLRIDKKDIENEGDTKKLSNYSRASSYLRCVMLCFYAKI